MGTKETEFPDRKHEAQQTTQRPGGKDPSSRRPPFDPVTGQTDYDALEWYLVNLST